jgi:hypothetical protein
MQHDGKINFLTLGSWQFFDGLDHGNANNILYKGQLAWNENLRQYRARAVRVSTYSLITMGNNLFKPIPHSVFYCANDNNDKKCSVKLTKAMIFTATDGSWLNSKSDQCFPTTLLME